MTDPRANGWADERRGPGGIARGLTAAAGAAECISTVARGCARRPRRVRRSAAASELCGPPRAATANVRRRCEMANAAARYGQARCGAARRIQLRIWRRNAVLIGPRVRRETRSRRFARRIAGGPRGGPAFRCRVPVGEGAPRQPGDWCGMRGLVQSARSRADPDFWPLHAAGEAGPFPNPIPFHLRRSASWTCSLSFSQCSSATWLWKRAGTTCLFQAPVVEN